MIEKIITTFETTITWFDPSDLLPEKEKNVLFKPKKDGTISTAHPWIGKFKTLWTGIDVFDAEGEGLCFAINDIQWWAPLPKFGDEE